MPLYRNYDYDYSYASDYGMLAHSSSMYLPTTPTSSGSYYDLNRSIYTTPTGCSMTYRLNQTVCDPENLMYSSFDSSSPGSCYTLDTTGGGGARRRGTKRDKPKSRGRVRSALRELFRPSRGKDSSFTTTANNAATTTPQAAHNHQTSGSTAQAPTAMLATPGANLEKTNPLLTPASVAAPSGETTIASAIAKHAAYGSSQQHQHQHQYYHHPAGRPSHHPLLNQHHYHTTDRVQQPRPKQRLISRNRSALASPPSSAGPAGAAGQYHRSESPRKRRRDPLLLPRRGVPLDDSPLSSSLTSSPEDLDLSYSCYFPDVRYSSNTLLSTTTTPRKKKERSMTYDSDVLVVSKPRASTLIKSYHRTPSADAAIYLMDEERRRIRRSGCPSGGPAPVRIQSFAMPEPRRVEFRRGRAKDAFVNSHEWMLSRSISELRLGIIGGLKSGKTSLVHRYLTGTFSAEESPEGGRFKKEVVIDGLSHLLLIRDEGNAPPDSQFTHWTDAVIFVYNVGNRESFERVRYLFNVMSKYRNINEMPLILVGTKDTISERNPREVTEDEGRQMALQLKRCTYYETCSTYGINVERVFKDACSKILQQRLRSSFGGSTRTPTPTTPQDKRDYQDTRYMANVAVYGSAAPPLSAKYQQQARSISSVPMNDRMMAGGGDNRRSHVHQREQPSAQRFGDRSLSAFVVPAPSSSAASSSSQMSSSRASHTGSVGNGLHTRSSIALLDGQADGLLPAGGSTSGGFVGLEAASGASASTSHLPTPSSTPTTQRKNRRISNIFQKAKDHSEEKTKAIEAMNMGVGRAIPIKQGHLYKKSTKTALNREWKKKYVCLYNNGKLTYHHNLKDYMDKSAHGKEVFLGLATVRIAGRQRPRNTQRAATNMAASQTEENALSSATAIAEGRKSDAGVTGGSGEGTSGGGSDDAKEYPPTPGGGGGSSSGLTPQTVAGGKKRRGAHRRLGSSGKHAEDDEECFEIITADQKRWEFCAGSAEERDEWVSAIEEQIEKAIQSSQSQPSDRAHGNLEEIAALRSLPGNSKCADCGQTNPEWASLNLGTLICIECSGVHRNLGSHISRVRSLELDDWPVEVLAVMRAIGNEAANKLWEHNAPKDKKPTPDAGRDAKEAWIRAKYEAKRFLPSLRVDETVSQQLIGAVLERNVPQASLLLARATADDVNATVSHKDRRTPLHLACSMGCIEMLQLLLWNNADIRALDEQGRSVLWHAHHNGASECADVLLAAGLPANYGMPPPVAAASTPAHMNYGSQISIPEGALANRDYSCLLQDDSDFLVRRGQSAANSRQAQQAFDLLPTSII